jgi:hypothetical protein
MTTYQQIQVNSAFKSLSFRGNRVKKQHQHQHQHKPTYREAKEAKEARTTSRVYGGILRTKFKGEYVYALVQGRYTKKWSFPKGHAYEGETALECTIREIEEETGIKNLESKTELCEVGYGRYYMFELDSPIKLIPSDTHEIIGTKWATLEEMSHLSLNADASFFLKAQQMQVQEQEQEQEQEQGQEQTQPVSNKE